MDLLSKITMIVIIAVAFFINIIQIYYLEERINHLESTNLGSSRCLK